MEVSALTVIGLAVSSIESQLAYTQLVISRMIEGSITSDVALKAIELSAKDLIRVISSVEV